MKNSRNDDLEYPEIEEATMGLEKVSDFQDNLPAYHDWLVIDQHAMSHKGLELWDWLRAETQLKMIVVNTSGYYPDMLFVLPPDSTENLIVETLKVVERKKIKLYNLRIEVMNDDLNDLVDELESEVRERIKDYINENHPFKKDAAIDDLERVYDDLDCLDAGDVQDDIQDIISELVDNAVPIYNYGIKCCWFLHGGELEDAYEDSGIGENPRENSGMTAIFLYLEQAVYAGFEEWFDEIKSEILEEIEAIIDSAE